MNVTLRKWESTQHKTYLATVGGTAVVWVDFDKNGRAVRHNLAERTADFVTRALSNAGWPDSLRLELPPPVIT